MSKQVFDFHAFIVCLAAATSVPALQAQQASVADGQCILAGRIGSDARWAPLAQGMQLLDAGGQQIRGANVAALASVKFVRLSKPALLTPCNAGQAMADGFSTSGSKTAAPALKASDAPIAVQATAMLPGRGDAQWVELRLIAPPERVTLLMR